MRTCTFLVVVAAMIYAIATPATGCGESYGTTSIEGGWEPIPKINDQHIQDLGRWAVLEFLKHANCLLKFNKVVSGKEQVVSGMNYELIIDASDASGKLGTYKAEVYEQERTKTRKLVSFSKAN
ncbi:cysteine proteinase inhibitor 8-like [Lolium rigidum]|uniref:cysteine proteinase inhibitor 8-like n=1 Tax=Lolium rigidum TaxID=89674 RepID=UPI001F5D273B|nr:cysteine proteinase inhibitor 8-like [Lolium rigidum]